VVYENGKLIQVPPFARPRKIELPEPYGEGIQYIIPHAETKTLVKALRSKGVQLIEVRGTWPEKNMNLIKSLYEYGILRNDKVEINGGEVGVKATYRIAEFDQFDFIISDIDAPEEWEDAILKKKWVIG
jgi:lysine 6-dehydrogenase